MRRVFSVFVVLAVLWCLWWLGAGMALRAAVADWLADRRAEGWQAEARAIDGGGFPLALVAQLREPVFADPATGVAVEAVTLRLETDAWWPGNVRAVLPEAPIRLAAPDGRAELTMTGGLMRMSLAPAQALTLRELSWTAGPWGLVNPRGSLVSADDLRLAMVQQAEARIYRIDVNAASAAPGEVLRTALRVPRDWPLAFDALAVEMTVAFDRPWDIRALEDRRPQPRRIDLALAEAAWGDLRLNLAAALDVDEAGVPAGTLSVQARNWREILGLAETAGVLPAGLRPQAERILESLAGASGNPETIDVRLTLRNGSILLGFIPLGPAPRIVLR